MPRPPNIFLDADTELTDRYAEAARNLSKLAGVLPAASQADDASYYSCSADSDVEATQTQLLERTGFVCLMARDIGWHNLLPLSPELVLNIHDGIFVPVFGDRTLSFRKAPRRGEHRDDDGVEYPIWVVQGSGLSPSIVTKRGARASQVERRVREVCAAFERAAPEAVDDVALGAELITRLYVRLIRVHPFGDGNGRTAWTAMQYAAGRVHFPLVQSTPTREARLALGDAIRNGREIHRLVKHVRDAAWAQ